MVSNITSQDFLVDSTTVFPSGKDNRNPETERYPAPKALAESGISLVQPQTQTPIQTPTASR